MSDHNNLEVYYKEDETGEWYTAVVDGEVYQMNGSPESKQLGFSQYIGTVEPEGRISRDALGDNIELADCPENIQNEIQDRL